MFKNRYNSYDSPQYDTDGSGEIEFPEFCNMMSNKMNQSDDAEMVKIMMMTIMLTITMTIIMMVMEMTNMMSNKMSQQDDAEMVR